MGIWRLPRQGHSQCSSQLSVSARVCQNPVQRSFTLPPEETLKDCQNFLSQIAAVTSCVCYRCLHEMILEYAVQKAVVEIAGVSMQMHSCRWPIFQDLNCPSTKLHGNGLPALL